MKTDIVTRRREAIQKFLEDNAELFTEPGGPWMLADWVLATQHIDLSMPESEMVSFWFRPGMTESQRLGLIDVFDDAVRSDELEEEG